jgi:hypothetical protein
MDLVAKDGLVELQISAACPLMLAVMLFRGRLYSQPPPRSPLLNGERCRDACAKLHTGQPQPAHLGTSASRHRPTPTGHPGMASGKWASHRTRRPVMSSAVDAVVVYTVTAAVE